MKKDNRSTCLFFPFWIQICSKTAMKEFILLCIGNYVLKCTFLARRVKLLGEKAATIADIALEG